MAKFHIKNKKDFFGSLSCLIIMTVEGLSYMEQKLQNPSPDMLSKFKESDLLRIKNQLATIASFPVVPQYLYFRKNDKEGLVYEAPPAYAANWNYGYGTGKENCYVVPYVTGFSISSRVFDHDYDISSGQFKKTVQAAAEIGDLSQLLELAKLCDITLNDEPFRSSKKLQKKIETEYTVSEIDVAAEFGQQGVYMIFLANENGGGYFGSKGDYVTLGSAKLYESKSAAEKTIKAKKWQGRAVVVCAKIQIDKYEGSVTKSGQNVSRIQEAEAAITRQKLKDALDGATVEQLRERLAKYEDVSLLAKKDGSPKKRSM